MRFTIIAIALLLLVAGAGVAWWLWGRSTVGCYIKEVMYSADRASITLEIRGLNAQVDDAELLNAKKWELRRVEIADATLDGASISSLIKLNLQRREQIEAPSEDSLSVSVQAPKETLVIRLRIDEEKLKSGAPAAVAVQGIERLPPAPKVPEIPVDEPQEPDRLQD